MKILIIGGGWAGIAAAVEAAERGHHVVLVEERSYLGGVQGRLSTARADIISITDSM